MHEDILALFPNLTPAVVNDKGVIYSFPGYLETETEDVYINEHTVQRKRIQKQTGVNRHSGKTWVRWKTLSTTVFSLKYKRDDQHILRVYSIQPRTRKSPGYIFNVTASAVCADNIGGFAGVMMNPRKEAFIKFLNQPETIDLGNPEINYVQNKQSLILATVYTVLFHKYQQLHPESSANQETDWQKRLARMAYPVTEMFPEAEFDKFLKVPGASRMLHGDNDVKVFIRKNLGAKAVRKDVVKATVKTTTLWPVFLGKDLKKLVPVDWVVMMMTDPDQYLMNQVPNYIVNRWNREALKMLFRKATVSQRKRLLLAKAKPGQLPYHVYDSLDMAAAIGSEELDENWGTLDFTTWQSLHNSLVRVSRDVKLKPREIPQAGITAELDGKTFVAAGKTYTVRSPKVNTELVDWGNYLNNCIASYSERVVNNSTKVFAVYTEDKKLYANLECRNNQIIQFVTNYNHSVPKNIYDAFQGLLEEAVKKVEQDKKKRTRKTREPAVA